MKTNSNNSSVCKFYGILFFLFFVAIPFCHADFVVHLKDGSSPRVIKIEFRDDKTVLFLTTGMTTRIQTDAIDFRNMALKRPDFPYGYSTDGITVHKIEQVVVKTGPSQQELKAQWDSARQTAIAIRDAGSVEKGQTVRIVQIGPRSTTVIVLDEKTNSYKRLSLSDEMFSENFELRVKKADARPKIKKPVPVEEPKEPEPVQIVEEPPKPIPVSPKPDPPSLWIPLGMSVGLLAFGFASTLVLSSSKGKQKKRK